MKKIIALIVLGLVGFYVGWPAWSGYRIAGAITAKDAGALAAKVDFPSVRASMRPAVSGLVERELDAQFKQASGPLGGLLGADLKKQLLPQLVDSVIETVVTPENIIRIATEGDAAATVKRILAEKMGDMAGRVPGAAGGAGSVPGLPAGGFGNLGGIAKQLGLPAPPQQPSASAPSVPPQTSSPATSAKPATFGLGNIKGFGFDGPLGFNASIARDAAAPEADLTAGMSFTGGDWKLTRVIPRL